VLREWKGGVGGCQCFVLSYLSWRKPLYFLSPLSHHYFVAFH
jgi:hypothetical protein